MAEVDILGWIAAGLTFATFSMRSMKALRIIAVGANVCFIAYGALGAIYPVLTLHLLLLPCNVFRLCQLHCHELDAGSYARRNVSDLAGMRHTEWKGRN